MQKSEEEKHKVSRFIKNIEVEVNNKNHDEYVEWIFH